MRNFVIEEFKCPESGIANMDMKFLNMLDDARDWSGVPYIITSGFRSFAHNKSIGGAPTSSHLNGYAADISTPDASTRYAVLFGLIMAGFTRIGIYEAHIHADADPHKAKKVAWHVG